MRPNTCPTEAAAKKKAAARAYRPAVVRLPNGRYACLQAGDALPGIGLELQRQLVATHCRIPIIFITSHEDDDARKRALEAGADAYLYKPFREEELLNAIDAALKHS